MNIKFNLQELLDARCMSRREIADISGVTAQSIHKLCHRPQAIRLDTLEKLCQALNVQPGDLFTLSSDDPA